MLVRRISPRDLQIHRGIYLCLVPGVQQSCRFTAVTGFQALLFTGLRILAVNDAVPGEHPELCLHVFPHGCEDTSGNDTGVSE